MSSRSVTVARTWKETPLLAGVTLDAPPELRAAHVHPGQVVAARPADRPEDKAVHLALANVPGEPLELLAAPSAVESLRLAPGAVILLEGPYGRGFPLELARGKDVLLFAVGSALAPIRPLVELIRAERGEYGRVSLYVGALADDAFPYRARFDAWKRDRIDVVPVLDPRWVQDVFAEDPLELEDAVAFVCGMQAMMDGVTEVLGRFGLTAEHVHRNW